MTGEGMATIVIENGSSTIKAGLSGADSPQVVIPSVVGRLRHPGVLAGLGAKESYIGHQALEKRGILMLRYPIEFSYITDFNDMEKLWRHLFYEELRVAPEEHPILITEPPLNTQCNREKTLQIMMETFCCPAMYTTADGVLALHASGRESGIVWCGGDRRNHTTPIYQGHVLPRSLLKEFLSGRDATDSLMSMLNAKGYDFTTSASVLTAKDMKDKLAYVALDYEQEIKMSTRSQELHKSYTLPDGQIIWLGQERFKCMEGLFNPEIMGKEDCGIPEMIFNVIMRCSEELLPLFYRNLILTGGTAKCPGIAERIEKELKGLAPIEMNDKIVVSPDNWFSAWKGGSMLASLSTFNEMCISKAEYDEYGPKIIHRKCF